MIGTIIGVIAFAVLISGATFAWLTYSVNVTGGTYNGASTNFVVNYTKGTDIFPSQANTAKTTYRSTHGSYTKISARL